MKIAIVFYLLISVFIPLQSQFEIESCTTTWQKKTPRLPSNTSSLMRQAIEKRNTTYQGTKSCQEHNFAGKAIRRVNPITRGKSLYSRVFN